MMAIKGMEEMPSCCKHCPCSDNSQCNLTTQYNDLKGRPDDCPLVEIVTCKDCRYCVMTELGCYCDRHIHRLDTHLDKYCADAERRE